MTLIGEAVTPAAKRTRGAIQAQPIMPVEATLLAGKSTDADFISRVDRQAGLLLWRRIRHSGLVSG